MHESLTCGARQTGYQPISKRIGFCETSSRGIETLFQSPVRHAPPAVVTNCIIKILHMILKKIIFVIAKK